MVKGAAGVALGLYVLLIAAEAEAETVFAVTSEDISVCSELGEIAAELAELKHRGISKNEMRDATLESGVSPEIGEAIVDVLFSFEASDPSVYKAVMGAFCLQDKLAPIRLPD